MNQQDEVVFWISMAISLIGLFILYTLIASFEQNDHQFMGWLLALMTTAAITFFAMRAFWRIVTRVNQTNAATAREPETEKKPLIESILQGALGHYSPRQWERILPQKPGRIVWGHPDRSGPVKLSKINDVAACIDKAIDVFYQGGSPRQVEKYLRQAGQLMPLPYGDGNPDYISYGEDQRPAMMAIMDEISSILAMVADPDSTDPRKRLLAAGDSEIRTISRSNTSTEGGWLEALVAEFENDPRIFDLDWNSGYHYTTGESSGNSGELAREGATEVGNFSMKCLAEDYPDLFARFRSITST